MNQVIKYWLFVSSIFSNKFFRKAENYPQQCTELLCQICGLWQSTWQLQFLLMTCCNWQVSYVLLLFQLIPGGCFNIGKKLIVKCSAVQLPMLVVYHLNPCYLYSVHVNQIYKIVFSLYTTQGGTYTLPTPPHNMKDIYLTEFRIRSKCLHRHQEILHVFVFSWLRCIYQ